MSFTFPADRLSIPAILPKLKSSTQMIMTWTPYWFLEALLINIVQRSRCNRVMSKQAG